MAEPISNSKSDKWIYITLALVTIVATLVTAVPGFLSLKAKRSLITYATSASEIAYPPSADVTRIKEVLAHEGIADSTYSVSLQNIGDQAALSVGVLISVPGEIVSCKSTPAAKDIVPWVTIASTFDPSNNPALASYELKNLAVSPEVKIDISYRRTDLGDPKCVIFADGFKAISAEEEATKIKSVHSLFEKAVIIFVLGTFLTAGVYIYRIRRLRDPRTSFLAGNKDYTEYKNRILDALLQKENVEFLSLSEGSYGADDPESFWDIQMQIKGIKIGIDVHTESQRWLSGFDRNLEFCARLSQMTRALDGKSFLAFDKANENSEEWQCLAQIISKLNRSNKSHTVVIVVGNPSEIAEKIISAIDSSGR